MKYKIILAIFIIAFISSALLAFSVPCGTEESCEVVQNSDKGFFEKTTNGYLGMAIFLFLSTITFFQMQKPTKQKRTIIHTGLIIGSIIAIYFLYLQQFVIEAYCTYCIIIDIGILIGLLIALFTWKK